MELAVTGRKSHPIASFFLYVYLNLCTFNYLSYKMV
jgi:hypothetical protein